MKNVMIGALLVLVALSSAALEPVVDDFWDTRKYATVAPNEQMSGGSPLVSASFVRGYAQTEDFDSCVWTLHWSNTLRIFRSTPAKSFIFQVR